VSKKRFSSDKGDFQLELKDGGLVSRRKTELLADGSFLFKDELETTGVLTPTIVICEAWLLEIIELKAGEIFFIQNEKEIRPITGSFGIFYPPFTIARPCFKNARGNIVGIAASASLPQKFTQAPFIFDAVCEKFPVSASQAVEILNSGENFQSIEINPKASLLSVKAKKLIDENYLIYPSIARVAARLGVSHAHLSRQFKNDFGMSPSGYLRQLRLADAPLKFAKGEKIINVSQDSGYNDLSRFYKQFRQTTQTSPGECQTIMKPARH
jgi:AraC-like DNA-binding protein